MIADVVNFAIAGVGFCHAAGRLILYKGIKASNAVITGKWVEPLKEDREWNIFDSTKNF
jgi:hypothetical protein